MQISFLVVDGLWTPWGTWIPGDCSVTCGGGRVQRTRVRYCNNPPPRNGGRYCVGSNVTSDTQVCANFACPGKPSLELVV